MFGTLDLTFPLRKASKFTGTLVQAPGSTSSVVGKGPLVASGHTLAVKGSLHNQIMKLNVRIAPKRWVQWIGPVVSARLPDGQITLDGGGVLASGNQIAGDAIRRGKATVLNAPALQPHFRVPAKGTPSTGTFTLHGPSAVLPADTLQNPRAVKRIIPAGTTLVPTAFLGQVTQGPDKGLAVRGVLSLGQVGSDGSIAGTLADPINGPVPVTGRVVGQRIQLNFNLGSKGTAGGVGPFIAKRVGPGQMQLTAFGSLQTGNPADSGDWSYINSVLNNMTLSNLTGYVLNQDGVYLIGTNFTGTTFSQATLTDSEVDPTVQFLNADFSAVPGGANLTNTTFLSGSSLAGTKLSAANLTGANLTGVNLTGTNLTSANLASANFTGQSLGGYNLTGDNLTMANLTGDNLNASILTGTNLTGANLTNAAVGGPIAGTGQNLSGFNLTGTILTGATLAKANLTGATLTGTNLTGATLTNATLTGATLSGIQLDRSQSVRSCPE